MGRTAKKKKAKAHSAFMKDRSYGRVTEERLRKEVADLRDEVAQLVRTLRSIRASTADIHDTYECRGGATVEETLDLIANVGRIIQSQCDDEIFRRGDPGYWRSDANHWATLDERIRRRAQDNPGRMDPVTGVEPWRPTSSASTSSDPA
jgi:hypothetical protein